MKIYEVTGKIRENPQPPGQMTKMKVVQASPNQVTLQNPETQAKTTFDPSKNPNAIQQGPEGITVNPMADPNAAPPTPQLQQGAEVNMAATDAPSQPGSPLTPNPPGQGQQQNQAAAEEMEEDPEMVEAGYVPTGYDDDYREKAMMRKAMQNVTDKDHYFEGKDIVNLAKRISNVEVKSSAKQKQDVIDLKKLAGL
jgi:hypothetical protein